MAGGESSWANELGNLLAGRTWQVLSLQPPPTASQAKPRAAVGHRGRGGFPQASRGRGSVAAFPGGAPRQPRRGSFPGSTDGKGRDDAEDAGDDVSSQKGTVPGMQKVRRVAVCVDWQINVIAACPPGGQKTKRAKNRGANEDNDDNEDNEENEDDEGFLDASKNQSLNRDGDESEDGDNDDDRGRSGSISKGVKRRKEKNIENFDDGVIGNENGRIDEDNEDTEDDDIAHENYATELNAVGHLFDFKSRYYTFQIAKEELQRHVMPRQKRGRDATSPDRTHASAATQSQRATGRYGSFASQFGPQSASRHTVQSMFGFGSGTSTQPWASLLHTGMSYGDSLGFEGGSQPIDGAPAAKAAAAAATAASLAFLFAPASQFPSFKLSKRNEKLTGQPRAQGVGESSQTTSPLTRDRGFKRREGIDIERIAALQQTVWFTALGAGRVSGATAAGSSLSANRASEGANTVQLWFDAEHESLFARFALDSENKALARSSIPPSQNKAGPEGWQVLQLKLAPSSDTNFVTFLFQQSMEHRSAFTSAFGIVRHKFEALYYDGLRLEEANKTLVGERVSERHKILSVATALINEKKKKIRALQQEIEDLQNGGGATAITAGKRKGSTVNRQTGGKKRKSKAGDLDGEHEDEGEGDDVDEDEGMKELEVESGSEDIMEEQPGKGKPRPKSASVTPSAKAALAAMRAATSAASGGVAKGATKPGAKGAARGATRGARGRATGVTATGATRRATGGNEVGSVRGSRGRARGRGRAFGGHARDLPHDGRLTRGGEKEGGEALDGAGAKRSLSRSPERRSSSTDDRGKRRLSFDSVDWGSDAEEPRRAVQVALDQASPDAEMTASQLAWAMED